MNYLLDTNVLSEWVKPRPDEGVMRWLHETDEDELLLSAVTLAELHNGIEKLKNGRRKTQLQGWVAEDLRVRFAGRIVVVDEQVAEWWGRLMAESELRGQRMGIMDGFLAATAEAHQLALVTRDVAAFAGLVTKIHNPWKT